MQLEIAAVTAGISAFIRRGGLGIGLGLATIFYFINIIANLMEETKILKYFTPCGYTDGASIIADNALHAGYLSAGIAVFVVGIVVAYLNTEKKILHNCLGKYV